MTKLARRARVQLASGINSKRGDTITCTGGASGLSEKDTEHEHCTNYCRCEVIFVVSWE